MHKNLLLLMFALFFSMRAHAIHTTASFDANYAVSSLGVVTKAPGAGSENSGTLTSTSGYEIDYNVSLFDFNTIATLSFSQFLTSSYGETPITRLALGGSYHFIRMNGERIVLDNQVESKSWGISPAIELSLGLTSFSPRDSTGIGEFTASMFDILPRFMVEIPINPTFLMILRAGYLKSLSLLSTSSYQIAYSGYVFSLGIKLTTL